MSNTIKTNNLCIDKLKLKLDKISYSNNFSHFLLIKNLNSDTKYLDNLVYSLKKLIKNLNKENKKFIKPLKTLKLRKSKPKYKKKIVLSSVRIKSKKKNLIYRSNINIIKDIDTPDIKFKKLVYKSNINIKKNLDTPDIKKKIYTPNIEKKKSINLKFKNKTNNKSKWKISSKNIWKSNNNSSYFNLISNIQKFKKKLYLKKKKTSKNCKRKKKKIFQNINIKINNNNYHIEVVNENENKIFKKKNFKNIYYSFENIKKDVVMDKSVSFNKNNLKKFNFNLDDIRTNNKNILNFKNKYLKLSTKAGNEEKYKHLAKIFKINYQEDQYNYEYEPNKIKKIFTIENQTMNSIKNISNKNDLIINDNNLVEDSSKYYIKNIIIWTSINNNKIINIQFIYIGENKKKINGYKHGCLNYDGETYMEKLEISENDKLLKIFFVYNLSIEYISINTLMNNNYEFGETKFNELDKYEVKEFEYNSYDTFIQSIYDNNILKLIKIN